MGIMEIRRNRSPMRTSTRPPPIATSAPCPYRNSPHSVVEIYQDAGRASIPMISGFCRQNSTGMDCTFVQKRTGLLTEVYARFFSYNSNKTHNNICLWKGISIWHHKQLALL